MLDLGILGFSHVGFAVHDIEEFRDTWGAMLGVTDFAVVDVDHDDGFLQIYGEPAPPASLRVAFAKVANIAIELVQPVRGRTRTADWLDTHGTGIHHLAFWVRDLRQAVAALDGVATVTYSPTSLIARGTGELPVAPATWAYTEAIRARTHWCLELFDVGHAPVMRERYGNHMIFPPEQA
jgi:methylmalonyl-CoA/ethylmalonyl-CoA epimerase